MHNDGWMSGDPCADGWWNNDGYELCTESGDVAHLCAIHPAVGGRRTAASHPDPTPTHPRTTCIVRTRSLAPLAFFTPVSFRRMVYSNGLTGTLPTQLALLSALQQLCALLPASHATQIQTTTPIHMRFLPTCCPRSPRRWLYENALHGTMPTHLGLLTEFSWMCARSPPSRLSPPHPRAK